MQEISAGKFHSHAPRTRAPFQGTLSIISDSRLNVCFWHKADMAITLEPCDCRVLTELMFRDCCDGLANLRYLGGQGYIHRPPTEKSATLSGSREEIPRKCCQNEETNRSSCPHSTCATLRHTS